LGVATNLANDILSGTSVTNLVTLGIIPGLLEQYNIRYTEKWVKRIDENFAEYNLGTKPTLNIPGQPLPRHLRYITDKFFSGDVSGMIAESVFVYLLDQLGIDINQVGHLRPLKRRRAFLPDFAIWDNGPSLGSLLVPTPALPVYAEVKGCSSGLDESRIAKALTQLNKLVGRRTSVGLIFVLFKDAGAAYQGALLEVRP
jgi:hypothetical protein